MSPVAGQIARRGIRGALHAVLILAALLPGLSLGDAAARVAPAAVILLWVGARHARGFLRGLYALLAGSYAAVALAVAVWPWTADPPWWLLVGMQLLVGTLAFWTAGSAPWWRAGLVYSIAIVPLLIAFFVALSIDNPFETGWRDQGRSYSNG